MVEAARDVEGDRDLPAVDELGCLKRCAGHESRPFEDPFEYGVVAEAEAVTFLTGYPEPAVCGLQDLDVISRVIKEQIVFLRRLRLDNTDIRKREESVRLYQIMGELQPEGLEPVSYFAKSSE